ncbi:nucleoside 2-deoxyribosyltransferase [Candidatus Aenigmatarchaeota archaeon]
MFYLSSPVTDPNAIKDLNKEYYLRRNERIAKKLEDDGIVIYLPQRDTDQTMPPKQIFLQNIKAIQKSEGLIIVLSDSRGIYMEAGFARALDKKIVGLKVDETQTIGRMVRNFLDNIVDSTDELVLLLKNINSISEQQ